MFFSTVWWEVRGKHGNREVPGLATHLCQRSQLYLDMEGICMKNHHCINFEAYENKQVIGTYYEYEKAVINMHFELEKDTPLSLFCTYSERLYCLCIALLQRADPSKALVIHFDEFHMRDYQYDPHPDPDPYDYCWSDGNKDKVYLVMGESWNMVHGSWA